MQISSSSVDTARSSPSAPTSLKYTGKARRELLGHEVDRLDISIQEAGHIALEQVGVGDVDATQPQLHVQSRREPLIERRVRLDDVHPTADLGEVVGVDHSLPLVGGSLDIGVLKAPVEHVLDKVVGRRHIAGLADGDPDGLIALKTHEQELVVASAEEAGQPAEHHVRIRMTVGRHQLADHSQQVHHHFVLAIAQGVVFEKVKADREPVFDVGDTKDPVDRLVYDAGEGGQLGRQESVEVARPGLGDERLDATAGEIRETGGHRSPVGEFSPLRHGPLGDKQALCHSLVPQQEQRPVQFREDRRQLGALSRGLQKVPQEVVALQRSQGLAGNELGETAGHIQQAACRTHRRSDQTGPPCTK